MRSDESTDGTRGGEGAGRVEGAAGGPPLARPAPRKEWAVGIYSGGSPLCLAPAEGATNPVLTRRDVTDVPALFVADPFMLRRGGVWFMFFEVLNASTGLGEIGLAESVDGRAWRYRRIVLAEPFHLSYPHVFEHEGEFYMTPETIGLERVELYKARDFPERWERAGALVEGARADPTPFRHEGRWWMYACTTPHTHDSLSLYHAEELSGPWTPHPRSPLLSGDRQRARPAGRVVSHAGRLIRFAQDCSPVYGTRVRAFAINSLTVEDYAEEELPESPVLGPVGEGWNGCRMHHLDAHEEGTSLWLACVDGDATA